MKPKILAFSGSLRRDSFNQKLVKNAANDATEAGAEVTVIALRDYPLPLYDQDEFDQGGFPETVLQLKQLFKSSQGFLIASPEYNGSFSGVLKNAIDWLSRAEPGEDPLALSCFRGKCAALMSTSPGPLGGLRGLEPVRSVLTNVGMLVLPQSRAIPSAFQAFDTQGNLVDEANQTAIAQLAQALVTLTRKL